MSLRFTLAMARRESRSTRRRLVPYVCSVALGVGALVAITAFRSSVAESVATQSRALLGADLELTRRSPFDEPIERLIGELERLGSEAARVTRFSAMALAARSGRTRMVYVQAVSGGFPFHGRIETEPAGAWETFRSARRALVDPGVLIQLDAAVGDVLSIGAAHFTIAGTITRSPGDIGLRNTIAPRVFIPARYLGETELLQRGSLVVYSAYFKLDDPEAARALLKRSAAVLNRARVRHQTAAEYEQDLTRSLGRLASFLGLVGLVALLLGGIGVATGVHVFATEKLDTAATLRCLGARQRDVFAIYLLQAGALGLLGGAAGALLGLAVQAALPSVIQDLLPVEVPFVFDLGAVLTGLLVGVWVSLLFAILPLLTIREVSPLRALRRAYEPLPPRWDAWRGGAVAALIASLLAGSLWQARHVGVGLGFAGGIAAGTAVLALSALALIRTTRRFCPRHAPYWLRQGVANLFRPRNQTLPVTLALGFGVFLIASLHAVQTSLLGQLDLDRSPHRPNLALFDIQRDQHAAIASFLDERGAPILEETPIVPARILRLGGQSVDSLLGATPLQRGRRWALRREYRLTYRPELRASEQLLAGRWWSDATDGGVAQISIEGELAADLGVGVGDRLTWDIQGVPVETRVANLRRVNWARFETNFFVVFEPGVLEEAPQSLVLLSRVDGVRERAILQRDLVGRFPNVSAIDATVVLEALDRVLARVGFAIRFMATFAIASGLVILIGAIATSRYQRARESVLLRTLGGQSRMIRRVLATEYFLLGALAGLVGVTLACLSTHALMRFLFEQTARLPLLDLALIASASALLTTTTGLLTSRDTLRRTPLAGIREVAEAQ